jgi:ribosomal protein S18 acetylase RimI-like enzyme
MKLRAMTPDDFEPVRQFLSEMGWEARVSDPAKFRKMLAHTSRTVVAFEGSHVIGFARALCDEVSNGYISMVAVAHEKRRRGVGRKLVQQLMGNDAGITWLLRAGHGSNEFWEKMGFRRSEVAMERVRI